MADAAELDRNDPLARFREEFFAPPGIIYLDGNSLGLLSRRAEASLRRTIEEWRTLGIDGWLQADPPWASLPETLAAKMAPLVGADPASICITGQTTANLHQLLATLLPRRPAGSAARGPIIVGDALNFASDTYALQSHVRIHGLDPATHLRLIPSRDGRILRLDDILEALTDDVDLAVLPSVVYTSGQLLDIATLTRKAHERGILIGWDLSHSIGAVPHALDRDEIDFAVWSHYKWLNAGPGSVGGLYLNRRHFHHAPGMAGWWGVRPERRFQMPAAHEPAAGAAALHIGTPHILSLAPLLGSLELIAEAGGVEALRTKSLALTSLLIDAAEAELGPLGFTVVTPRGSLHRGGHVALAHPEAWRICQALKAAGIVADFRHPDLIRLAPSPLYTRFVDVAATITELARTVSSRSYEQFPATIAAIP